MVNFTPEQLAGKRYAEQVKRVAAFDGILYSLTDEQFRSAVSSTTLGLGDLVAAVATPIARALHLPCIDPATKQLRPDSGCAKRKAALNRLTQ